MQTIEQTPWKRLVPAFVAAVLVFGAMAMPPAHAAGPNEQCTQDMQTRLTLLGVTSVGPTNVAVAAQADGEFEVTWDNPPEVNVSLTVAATGGYPAGSVPTGTVIAFCVEKTTSAQASLDETTCKCRSGTTCPSDWGTASSLTSLTADSCFVTQPSGQRTLCGGGTFNFRVKLIPGCSSVDDPWSGTVSAVSTEEE